MRKALVILIALALAAPAMAVWDFPSGGGKSGPISVTLVIPCWTQIDWQDTAIAFTNDATAGGGDWYRPFGTPTGERGVYLALTGVAGWPDTWDKASTDPWANGYYESRDDADIYMKSNCDLTMAVANGLDLTGASTSHTMDTWYTIAGCGNGGFWEGGVYHNDGTPPLSAFPGAYLADDIPPPPAVPDGIYEWGIFHPNQYPFPMTTGGGSLAMLPIIDGTMTFHARVERNNINDFADTYTTSIVVTFSSVGNP